MVLHIPRMVCVGSVSPQFFTPLPSASVPLAENSRSVSAEMIHVFS